MIFSLLFTSCATGGNFTNLNKVGNPKSIFKKIERNSKKYYKTTIRLTNRKSFGAKNLKLNSESISFFDTKNKSRREFPLSELNRIVIEKKKISKGKEFFKWAWIGPTIGGILALIFKSNIKKEQNYYSNPSNNFNKVQNMEGMENMQISVTPEFDSAEIGYVLSLTLGIIYGIGIGAQKVIEKDSKNKIVYEFTPLPKEELLEDF